MNTTDQNAPKRASKAPKISLVALAPFIALILLIILGALVNPRFIGLDNLLNVATRSAFIAIIAIGATFVISAGDLDLSVGAMLAFVASLMIMFLNSGAEQSRYWRRS